MRVPLAGGAVLLPGLLLGCVSSADPAAVPPLRLEVSRVRRPPHALELDVRLVPDESLLTAEGTLYAERPSFPDAPVQERLRRFPPPIADNWRTVVGSLGGFSLKGTITLREYPSGAVSIPELVVEAPVDRILSFDMHHMQLSDGEQWTLRRDPVVFTFHCSSAEVVLFCGPPVVGMGPPDPEERSGWMASDRRDPLHCLRIEDASGAPLVQNGMTGHNVSRIVRWRSSAGGDGPIRYPVTVSIREPSRWERTVHRFVLKDIPVPKR